MLIQMTLNKHFCILYFVSAKRSKQTYDAKVACQMYVPGDLYGA